LRVTDLTVTRYLTDLAEFCVNQNAAMTNRRFPPPWSIEELDACFVVRDHNGQALAYGYFEDEPGRRSAAKLLSKDEAVPLRCLFKKTLKPKEGS
jgi:hypothetical protein